MSGLPPSRKYEAMIMMPKRAEVWPCPVEGCGFRARSEEGLFGHLYEDHRKADIIKALLALMRMRRT